MSFPNLTGLNLGTSATLAGKRFTVVGRVVMGMEEGGQTYCWNEFHLVDEANQSAILVHEVTEASAQWKLFTYVESSPLLTAPEAVAKRVGDRVNLDGRTARVTLVDELKVCFIEGQPPEGVEMGDVAKYFNAIADDRMYVVSWTGAEVEIFRGINLPAHAVAAAFNLRQPLHQPGGAPLVSEEPDVSELPDPHRDAKRWIVKLSVVVAMIGLGFGFYFSSPSRHQSRKAVFPVKPPTPAAPLVIGTSSQLRDTPWRVAGHALVEVRTPHAIYERHEYHLAADDGTTALLICGLAPARTGWYLLDPATFEPSLSPMEAATKRAGQGVSALGQAMKIEELFLSTVRSTEGVLPSDLAPGTVAYSFRAEAKNTVLLARWTETGITCHVGELLPSEEVTKAWGKTPSGQVKK